MLGPVNLEESLSRYILDRSYIRVADRTVRYNAFMPTSNREVSVFRILGLADSEIWQMGDLQVARKRGKPLLGRADILVMAVIKNNLQIDPDNDPPRHANILGWPEQRSEQKLIALKIAADSQLHLRKDFNLLA
jgi:hypothetical protein